MDTDSEDSIPSQDEVIEWLQVLLHPDINREPDEFYIERTRMKEYREKVPLYPIAAARWPEYAQLYSEAIEPLLLQLFRIPRSWNFVQWFLEYARQTQPDLFGDTSKSHDAILKLTDALCDRSVSPIHISAAFSLHEVLTTVTDIPVFGPDHSIDDLDEDKWGFLGTPLFCALAGVSILPIALKPESWLEHFEAPYISANAKKTINGLLDDEVRIWGEIRDEDDYHPDAIEYATEREIPAMAFCAALITGDLTIFSRIMRRWIDYDPLMKMLAKLQVSTVTKYKNQISTLITMAMDVVMEDWGSLRTTEEEQQLVLELEKFMLQNNLALTPGKVESITDEMFCERVYCSVADEDTIVLQRLTLDPRFDPNTPAVRGSKEGTLLHMAAGDDNIPVMELLLKAGGDIDRRDSHGRTVLMTSESVGMLTFLLAIPGANASAVDAEGRNIWHYAAATSELGWMSILLNHDPQKTENLAAKSKLGRTPLDAALYRIITLGQTYPLTGLPIKSRAGDLNMIKLLLRHKAPFSPEIGGHPVSHLAVSWGDVGIVKTLSQRGVDFAAAAANDESSDNDSAMQCLNTASSPEMVQILTTLCGGFPVSFQCGSTLADLLFSSAPLIEIEGIGDEKGREILRPSAHPACFTVLNEKTYKKLLTPQVIAYRDSKGRTLWERFCTAALRLINNYDIPAEEISMAYIASIEVAIKCIVATDAIKLHEEATGESGLACYVRKGESQSYAWICRDDHFQGIVAASNPDLAAKFFQNELPPKFHLHLFGQRSNSLIQLLIGRGFPVTMVFSSAGARRYPDSTLIEFLIRRPASLGLLGQALKRCTPEMLNQRVLSLSAMFCDDDEHFDRKYEKLKLLLEHGFASDSLRQASHYQALHKLLMHGLEDKTVSTDKQQSGGVGLIKILVKHAGGIEEIISNQLPDIVRQDEASQFQVLLAVLVSSAGLWTKKFTIEDNFNYFNLNIAQYAALYCSYEVIDTMISKGNGIFSDMFHAIIEATGQTIAHLAVNHIERGGRTSSFQGEYQLKTIANLYQAEVDLQILDSKGQTALHRALETGQGAFVESLLNVGAKDIPDKDGHTASWYFYKYASGSMQIKMCLGFRGLLDES